MMKTTFINNVGDTLFEVDTDTVPRVGEQVNWVQRYKVVGVTYTKRGFKLECTVTLIQVA